MKMTNEGEVELVGRGKYTIINNIDHNYNTNNMDNNGYN